MDRERKVARAVYIMVAADAVLVFLLVLVIAPVPAYLERAGAIFLPTVLIANYLFLRHSLRQVGPPETRRRSTDWAQRFWLYVGSGIFLVGALCGLLTILSRDLPKSLLPALLIPLLIALYGLKMARKAGRSG